LRDHVLHRGQQQAGFVARAGVDGHGQVAGGQAVCRVHGLAQRAGDGQRDHGGDQHRQECGAGAHADQELARLVIGAVGFLGQLLHLVALVLGQLVDRFREFAVGGHHVLADEFGGALAVAAYQA
jgi:hypothetical protein